MSVIEGVGPEASNLYTMVMSRRFHGSNGCIFKRNFRAVFLAKREAPSVCERIRIIRLQEPVTLNKENRTSSIRAKIVVKINWFNSDANAFSVACVRQFIDTSLLQHLQNPVVIV